MHRNFYVYLFNETFVSIDTDVFITWGVYLQIFQSFEKKIFYQIDLTIFFVVLTVFKCNKSLNKFSLFLQRWQ